MSDLTVDDCIGHDLEVVEYLHLDGYLALRPGTRMVWVPMMRRWEDEGRERFCMDQHYLDPSKVRIYHEPVTVALDCEVVDAFLAHTSRPMWSGDGPITLMRDAIREALEAES